MSSLRLFIAIPLPEAVQREFAVIQERLRRSLRSQADVKWVEPEHIHLTLKFLGHVEEDAVTPLEQTLDRLASEGGPFTLHCAGVGAFPSARSPRVIWVGVDQGGEEAARLAARVDEALEPLGFAPEERAFTPHLTLGRVRSSSRLTSLVKLLEAESFSSGMPFAADRVVLFQSTLTPQGPVYTALHTSPFHPS